MTHFNELLKKEIFEKPKPEKVLDKLEALFEAFSESKEVLLVIENYCVNELVSNERFTAEQKNQINKTLKQNWLKYWKDNMDISDMPIIHKYFYSFGPSQQEKVNGLIEKNCGKEHTLKPTEKTLLTIVLEQYRKGDPTGLEDFVNNASEIKRVELDRIATVMQRDQFIDNTLPIYVKAFEKCKSADFLPWISVITKLKQPPEHFVSFTNLLEKTSDDLSDNDQAKQMLYETLNVNTLSKIQYIGALSSLLYKMSLLSSDQIINALKNIEFVLNKNDDFLQNGINRKFMISSKGLDMIFDTVPYMIKNYKELKYHTCHIEKENFIEIIENIKKIHNYSILNENLDNKENSTSKRKI